MDYPGAFNHVMIRGVGGFTIFRDDLDRFVFLDRARKQFDGEALRCMVWALMSNHGHLATQTGTNRLSRGMHALGTGYAGYFNRRHERQGHVFQNRYKSLLIEEETYLLRAVRYVMLNPIRGGIVRDLGELADYPWTSYPALLGRGSPRLGEVDFTLRLFADGQGAARRQLRSWMLDGLRTPDPFEQLVEMRSGRPTKEVTEALKVALIGERDSYVVGNGRFISSVLSGARAPKSAERGIADAEEKIAGLIARTCAEIGVEPEDLRAGRRSAQVCEVRAAVARLGVMVLGVSQTELAKELGVSRSGVHRALARGASIVEERFGHLKGELERPAVGRSS